MSSIVNKVKEALHSDKSSHTEGTHTHAGTTAGHTTGTTGGLHESSHAGTGTHEGAYGSTGLDSNRHNAQRTDGPHGNLGNKLDPRVDSDRDHSRNLGANPDRSANTTSHTGHTGHTGGLTGGLTGTSGTHTTGLTGSSGTHTTGLDSRHNAQRTDGPHGNLGNKLDPRVDSDRDHSRNLGANPDRSANTTSHTGHTGHTGGLTGSTGTHTGGLTGSHAGTTTGTSGLSGGLDNRHNAQRTDGPHGNLGNKLDPRVDSDRDHSRNLGANPDRSANTTSHTGHTGHTGGLTGSTHTGGLTGSHAGTTGTSGLSGGHTLGSSTGTSGATTGLHGSHTSGPAPNTQGPHKSDLLNKADPRVDSDADGSKTYGGDKTFAH